MPETICNACGCTFHYDEVAGAAASASGYAPGVCASCDRKAKERERAAEAAEELALRNIPRRYASASFADFMPGTDSQRKALEACRDHAAGGVFLVGRAGVGKTLLAACAVKAGRRGSLFVSTTTLLDDIRAAIRGAGDGLFERAQSAPLLALDDLGAEHATDYARERLHVLLDHRWNMDLPLIVTTNLSPRLIAERIGEQQASRLKGLCKVRIEVRGADGRGRQPRGEHAHKELA